MSFRRDIRALLSLGLVLPALPLFANGVYTQSAPCAPGFSVCDINDADPVLGPGITVSDMVISQPSLSIPNDGNNNLTLSIIGLQHPEAGDLIVQLTNVTYSITVDVFYRIGLTNPVGDTTDPGYQTNFGDNYDFNGSYSNDLWTVASPLGTADFIPGDSSSVLYLPVTINDVPSNLSTAFNGLPITGTWELTITDAVPGPPFPSNNPQFNGWSLTSNVAAAPEPAYTGLFGLLSATALWFGRRRSPK